MGCMERYFRNRMKFQIFANYVGVLGNLYFALQNLSTNWGGDYTDDASLTDAIKAHTRAGIAWDEQHLQVGALQVAWLIYVLGLELQGNLSPGRYKRVMTWMVHVPCIAFMIGNMVLSSRRKSDGIITDASHVWDIVVGICFLVGSLICLITFAVHKAYRHERWLVFTERKLSDYYDETPKGRKSFTANRHLPQLLLHLLAMACLLYFAIVGLHHYDTMRGWLLTDVYKADALAVKVWGIAGASVGMLAVPLLLMFFGFELQGDLKPSNYKPMSAFVGCLNIFTVSLFLYSTTWDAFTRGVIVTHLIPMVIMIVLCLWAIVLLVLDATVVPYSDAAWLKILADPQPSVGPDDVENAFKPPLQDNFEPAIVDNEDEYITPPTPPRSRSPDHHVVKLEPFVEEEDHADILVTWSAPPDTDPSTIEYRLAVTEHDDPTMADVDVSASSRRVLDSPEFETQYVILPGDSTSYLVDHFMGEPIIPGEHFDFEIAYRHLSDRDLPNGGWKGASDRTRVQTKPMTEPSMLLRHRRPRVHLRDQITFKSNSDRIKSGEEQLPEIAQYLLDYPDLRLGIEGHVNFGQKERAALRLSLQRAERIVDALAVLGVDVTRLEPSGHGWSRPRYPRHSKYSGRNRRVEFVILPGSSLYRELIVSVIERHDAAGMPPPEDIMIDDEDGDGVPEVVSDADEDEDEAKGAEGAGAGSGVGHDNGDFSMDYNAQDEPAPADASASSAIVSGAKSENTPRPASRTSSRKQLL